MDESIETQQGVEEQEQSDPVAEVEAPTFAVSLQWAITRFSESLDDLTVVGQSVVTAEAQVTVAQEQLNRAQATRHAAALSSTQLQQAAAASRDELVAVLQSWTPS